MSAYYHTRYFNSKIFDYDYEPIAAAIGAEYHPKTVIEFGCGNGQLSRAFAQAGIHVNAIDGYATPDFSGFKTIRFNKVDLNDTGKINEFLRSLNKRFDVAVCLEVAEHLRPEVSEGLINALTAVSDTVIFSAAIPGQDGDGHINCRTREFWHELFGHRGFLVADTIRQRIRNNDNVGKWYQLNAIDYVRGEHPYNDPRNEIIKRLIASESEAARNYYIAERKLQKMQSILNFELVKGAFTFRNSLKRLMGKKPVVLPE